MTNEDLELAALKAAEETRAVMDELAKAKAQVAAMKLRALAAHEACYRAMRSSPDVAIAALGDHGFVHEAIHAILAVETESVTAPEEWRAHLGRQDERIDRLEAERTSSFSLASFFDTKAAWSRETFGDLTLASILAHLRKELVEIEADPSDVVEWADVVMLAIDGAARFACVDGALFVRALVGKHERNLARKWPAIGSVDPTQAVEHVRDAGDFVPRADALIALAREVSDAAKRRERNAFHERWGHFTKCKCGRRVVPADDCCRQERVRTGYAPPPEAP